MSELKRMVWIARRIPYLSIFLNGQTEMAIAESDYGLLKLEFGDWTIANISSKSKRKRVWQKGIDSKLNIDSGPDTGQSRRN
jgi:hypothetical protein